ncbi:MAG TPA: leucyl/phenylalanyl-tRNA--protein transferase [Polyangia bacterium]
MPRIQRLKSAIVDEMRLNLVSADDGLVAVGGTLHPEVLEQAYRMGVFPWSSEPAVTWWCPDPRAIFELAAFRQSRSLRKRIRQSDWTFHIDRDFEGTIKRCAEPTAERPETWITADFVASYCELHRRGKAHSVEVYEGGEAVGGLYGVSMGGFFGGESMFRRRDDASKAALGHLISHLRDRGFTLLDAQVMNPHLASLGARDISRAEFLRRLGEALALPVTF